MIENYADALRSSAPQIGKNIHNMSEQQFWESGLFESAIERLRGQMAASMQKKRSFIESILEYMKQKGFINAFTYNGARERYDYEVTIEHRICVIETKGCLDGNNTNIFVRPQRADEFIIWSLCQNMGADPRHNAWSGIHTRLSAEIIYREQLVDGVVIWDMLCGTAGRPCPKMNSSSNRVTKVGDFNVPPPCMYLLPRKVPHPKQNPNPPIHQRSDVRFLDALYKCFNCDPDDVVEVSIEADMDGANMTRRTIYSRNGQKIAESDWTIMKR